MKKIILFLPVLIISVIISCMSITANATYDEDSEFSYGTAYVHGQHPSSYWGANPDEGHQNGLMMLVQNPDYNSNVDYYIISGSFSYESGILTISGSPNVRISHYNKSSVLSGDSYSNPLGYGSITSPIDLNSLTYNGCEIYSFDLWVNGEHIIFDPSAMNVTVTFNPTLSGEIDRSETLPSGVVTYQDLFNFNVINNSSFGIQWAMAIVEQGSSVDFDILDYGGADSRGADFIQHNDNIKYVYLSSEQVYLDTSMGMWTTATAYSSMHYVGSHSESGPNLVRWEMVNLQKNHNYDVVVYAVRNDGDLTSYVSNSLLYTGAVGSPVEFENIEEVYRSSFSLVNPALYNSSSKIGGAIANDNNSDYNEIANTLYSYTEATEDDTITNYGKYDLRSDVRGYTGGSLSPVYGGSSSGSGQFNKLLTGTSSVFNFFSAVLKIFPSQFLTIFYLGFFALIVIAIIKRVT